MTSNQIEYKKAVETERKNRAQEDITRSEGKKGRIKDYVVNFTKHFLPSGDSVVKAAGQAASKNDPEWYKFNASAANNAAKLSFVYPKVGKSEVCNFTTIGDKVSADGWTSLLGKTSEFHQMMTLRFRPLFGMLEDKNSAAMTAANNMYAYVRSYNSGSRNYEFTDLMLHILAVDSLYMLYAMGTRAYGLLTRYSAVNDVQAKDMVTLCGFDYDTLASNPSRFKAQLDLMAAKLRVYVAPSNIKLFQRHAWLCSHVFKDKDNDKSNFYAFVPDSLYKFISTEGLLYNIPMGTDGPETLLTYQSYIDLFDELYNALIYAEDAQIINGDLIKAYGDKVYQVYPVADDYKVEPVYDKFALNQIANANVVSMDESSIGQVISGNMDTSFVYGRTTSGTAFVQWDIPGIPVQPEIVANVYTGVSLPTKTNILDSEELEPDTDAVLEMSRFVIGSTQEWDTTDGIIPIVDVYGTEVLTHAYIIEKEGTATGTYTMWDVAAHLNQAFFVEWDIQTTTKNLWKMMNLAVSSVICLISLFLTKLVVLMFLHTYSVEYIMLFPYRLNI